MAADPDLLSSPKDLVVAIKGAGDLATGIALVLVWAGIRQIYLLETRTPLLIRQRAAFGTAVFEGSITVEGVTATLARGPADIANAWQKDEVPVVPDPQWKTLATLPPQVLVDAILAKKNLGTFMGQAPLVIGLGPGFEAGKTVDLVIETQRGHDLGRIIRQGSAAADTGIPEAILGMTEQRLVRAPESGTFTPQVAIGTPVCLGQVLGQVGTRAVTSGTHGVVRGLIHAGSAVQQGQKIGDVDPRGKADYCTTASDKARALGGAVLTAILGFIHDRGR